jgi:hypothetical protein
MVEGISLLNFQKMPIRKTELTSATTAAHSTPAPTFAKSGLTEVGNDSWLKYAPAKPGVSYVHWASTNGKV